MSLPRCSALLAALLAFVTTTTDAFSISPLLLLHNHHSSSSSHNTALNLSADTWAGASAGGGGGGQIEQIEFKIHPDGRVEETVRGVKGNNCHKVTEKINEALGEVVSSQPTEEMFEQEVKVDQTLYNTNGNGSSADWEGSSSW